MKITSVDVTQLPSGNAGSSRGAWSPVLVRVNTDEGISGGREDIWQAGLCLQIRLAAGEWQI